MIDTLLGIIGSDYEHDSEEKGDAVEIEIVPSPAHFQLLRDFCIKYLSKLIVRYPEWTPCTGHSAEGEECKFGFLVEDAMEGRRVECEVCSCRQVVARRQIAEEDDEALCKMLAEGVMRKCPSCKLVTMKEFGVCNVIQCEKCSIWWNWRSRETGRNSRELKQKARMSGTLWEPGELDYQRTLESSDPTAFKSLLERNGVAYDPNYRRGT
jgi:hypothetical protein